MKYLVLAFVILSGLVTITPQANAQSTPIYTAWRDNDAVGGYDVVSFYSGKPAEGQNRFSAQHLGAIWKFSTRANLDLFKTNPDAFVPQYGGHCAWAAANGKLAKGSPKYWYIRDGHLYLNFNARIQEHWNRDIPGFIAKADAAWPKLIAE